MGRKVLVGSRWGFLVCGLPLVLLVRFKLHKIISHRKGVRPWPTSQGQSAFVWADDISFYTSILQNTNIYTSWLCPPEFMPQTKGRKQREYTSDPALPRKIERIGSQIVTVHEKLGTQMRDLKVNLENLDRRMKSVETAKLSSQIAGLQVRLTKQITSLQESVEKLHRRTRELSLAVAKRP